MVRMIRLKTLELSVFTRLISGVLKAPTTKQTYALVADILKLVKLDEATAEIYCILSALDALYEIHSLRKSIPNITKAAIMQIVENNLYSEIKENQDVGFKEFARFQLGIELSVFDEEAIGKVYNQIKYNVDNFLQEAIVLDLSIEDAMSYIPVFVNIYGECLMDELSQVICLLKNSDGRSMSLNFPGWSKFFYKNKIRCVTDAPKLLRLIAEYYDNKTYMGLKNDLPLTSLEQLLKLEEENIFSSVALGSWGFTAIDDLARLTPHELSIFVGERGLGKTTFAAFLAGNLICQKRKVLFYCPEIMDYKLLYNFVLPAYVKSKYDFVVTPDQCLGLESPYAYGSEYSAEEKVDIIKMAKMDFAESKCFYHLSRHLSVETLVDDLRTKIIEYEPEFLIFDHTLEVHGENNLNIVTQVLADCFEVLKKEFPIHILALSHTGSEFKVPTSDNPIITSKIVAWSKRLEGVADNIIGAFSSQGDKMNIFYTKLRWAQLIPMYQVFRMDRKHCWFSFVSEDQLRTQVDPDIFANHGDDNILDVEDDEEEFFLPE
jgi:hypothetical protein